jgi:hypothetical protein
VLVAVAGGDCNSRRCGGASAKEAVSSSKLLEKLPETSEPEQASVMGGTPMRLGPLTTKASWRVIGDDRDACTLVSTGTKWYLLPKYRSRALVGAP